MSYVYKRSEQQTAFPDIGGTYQLVPYAAPAGANVPQVYRLTSGADSRLFQLRNDDRMFARYHGVEFDIKKRMSNHWQANFGLTLSKATGRQGGGSARSTPLSSQVSTASIFGQNPNDYINSDGRLVGDRPVVLKTQFIYQWPLGDHVVLQLPESERQADLLGDSRDHQRHEHSWSDQNHRRGQRRSGPHEALADSRRPRREVVQAREGPEVAVFGDFLNLFNSDANESVLDRRLGNSNYLVPSRFILPRRLMVGAKFRF